MESIDGELICAICLEFYEEPLLLPCGHNFCKKCIYGVIENGAPFLGLVPMGSPSSYKCPVCQKGFSSKSNAVSHLPRNKALENIINSYISAAPVDIFDNGWNSELDVRISQCPKHQLPMKSFCRSCNLSACEKCEMEHHQGKDVRHRHKIFPIKDVAFKHQAEIAEALTEIKKRSINLNERLQLLKDLQQQIEGNEKSVMAELDHHMNTIMSAVRKQHEELKRRLKMDFTHVIKPVEEELRRCNSLKTSMHQLMKKVSDIKRTLDSGLRISLMIGAKKQLNSLLCFDIAWSLKDNNTPIVELPTWKLDVQHVLDSVGSLDWEKQENKTKSISTQTEVEINTRDTTSKESLTKIKLYPQGKTEGASDCTLSADNSGNTQQDKKAVSLSVIGIPTKPKVETTFGVSNFVTFGDKSGVRPKVKYELKESASLKLPENVEMDGLSSDSECFSHDESLVKVFTADREELSTPNLAGKKKENKNLSPSSAGHIEELSTRELGSSDGVNRMQQEAQIDTESKTKAKANLDMVQNSKDSTIHHDTNTNGENPKNEVDRTVSSLGTVPNTGARPKVTITTTTGTDNSKDPQTNDVLKPNNRVPKSDTFKLNDKIEPMEVAYSFDYDENDKNDEQFLSQSLNKISFNTRKEAREEQRKSFPPDPQVARPILKPRAPVTQRVQKPKQRSPHQDAVAKFVARRRTSSPHIPKTVSSQNLQAASNKVEFPKTLSSPALTEMSVKGGYNGEDKQVCMKFV